MPFGLIFGAIAALVLSVALGLQSIRNGTTPMVLAGTALIVTGITLALGLLLRQGLARWTGMVVFVFLTVTGFGTAMQIGSPVFHVLWLTAGVALLLLAIPATGDVRRGLAVDPETPPPPRGRTLGAVALFAFVGVLGCYGWAMSSTAPLSATTSTPDYVRPRVRWQDYGPALERARAEGKPIFIDFYADWCGPCRAMDRETFRDDEVVRRLEQIVAVRVDTEDDERLHGYSGVELAEKYRVLGYPTLMLLDPDGNVVTRMSGYASPRQFLDWLDEHVSGGSATSGESPPPVAL